MSEGKHYTSTKKGKMLENKKKVDLGPLPNLLKRVLEDDDEEVEGNVVLDRHVKKNFRDSAPVHTQLSLSQNEKNNKRQKGRASPDFFDYDSDDSDDTYGNKNDSSPSVDSELSSPSFTPKERDEDHITEEIDDWEGAFFNSELTPFLYESSSDAFFLDPTVDQPSRKLLLLAARNKEKNLFARNICSFKNGTAIMKHCAPWGECSVLCEDSFTIERKAFNAKGDISFVVVKHRSAPHREYMLSPEFFPGWTDKATLDIYYAF